jgi:Ca-activated chloride channel family protein
VDAPFDQEGIYLDAFKRGSEGIYQLAFLPARAITVDSPKKVAVLFDYDATKSSTGPGEVLARVKAALHTNFAASDSFNLIFSKLNILRASPSWLSGDSTVIEQTFAALDQNPISSYSNLPALLADGISFVQGNGNNGSLLLISNSDQVGDFEVANQLIDDILARMNPEIPLHIADYTYQNYSYHWIGGRAYYGNQYFYTNISRLTSGNYFNRFSGDTFAQVIGDAFGALGGFVSSFDLHMGLQNGPCYGRYNLGNTQEGIYLERPFLQIGKYQGDLPFIIDVSGVYENDVFSRQFIVDGQDIQQTDSLSEEAWTGTHIRYLESLPQTNDVVGEIVDYSISGRVLSVYSAFLCLEPSRGGEICYDCIDESGLVGIEEPLISAEKDSLLVKAYPNPFNSEVNITVNLSNVAKDGKTTYKIYNILGQVVRTFKPEVSTPGSTQHFVWHGKNDSGAEISSGTYFFVVRSGEKRYTLKLLLMK